MGLHGITLCVALWGPLSFILGVAFIFCDAGPIPIVGPPTGELAFLFASVSEAV